MKRKVKWVGNNKIIPWIHPSRGSQTTDYFHAIKNNKSHSIRSHSHQNIIGTEHHKRKTFFYIAGSSGYVDFMTFVFHSLLQLY